MGHLVRDCWCGRAHHPELEIKPENVRIEPIPLKYLHCTNAPQGWWCSRWEGHLGPCAARPRWWNLKARWKFRGMY